MRNLIEFVWRNQFTLIFFVLEIIGFFLLSSTNSFHQSKMHTASVAISGKIYGINKSYEQYIGLIDENNLLRQENALLRQRILNNGRNNKNSELHYHATTATVIKSTYNLGNNFIIIDKGYKQGVSAEMGVLSTSGIVGKVIHVSANFASIMPLLHSQSTTSVQLKKNGYFGRCRWNQLDPNTTQLLDIPNHVNVDIGDTVITRGAKGTFPSGEIVGFVSSTKKDPSEGFQEINITIATNFQNLKAVYLLKNNQKPELDSLLQHINQNFEWEED